MAVQFMKQFKLFMKGKKSNLKIPKFAGKKKNLLNGFSVMIVKDIDTLLVTAVIENQRKKLLI